jgi:uncharacterized protein
VHEGADHVQGSTHLLDGGRLAGVQLGPVPAELVDPAADLMMVLDHPVHGAGCADLCRDRGVDDALLEVHVGSQAAAEQEQGLVERGQLVRLSPSQQLGRHVVEHGQVGKQGAVCLTQTVERELVLEHGPDSERRWRYATGTKVLRGRETVTSVVSGKGPSALPSVDAEADHGPMRMEVQELQALSPQECERLLARTTVGRVGISMRALPVVLPVNYAMLDGDVVIRTGEGTKLDAALAGAVVAFEVDHVDPIYHEGWSVLLQGRAAEIADPHDIERARALPLRPWAPGTRDRYIRIPAEVISGRRIAVAANGGTQ